MTHLDSPNQPTSRPRQPILTGIAAGLLGLVAPVVAAPPTVGGSHVQGSTLNAPAGARHDEYDVRAWGVEDGLPQVSVTSIVQTHDGYLWLGTFGGLARFDGVRFDVFGIADTPALRSNRILALHEDRSRRLWVGTMNGLARLEDGVFREIPASEGAPGGFIRSIVEDPRDGSLWIGGQEGVVRFVAGRFERFDALAGLSIREAASLAVDETGVLWMGLSSGLGRFDGERFGMPEQSLRPPGAPVFFVSTADPGFLWVDDQSTRLAQAGPLLAGALEQTRPGQNFTIARSRTGTWLGADAGLARVVRTSADDAASCEWVLDADQAPAVRAILEDREGNLWVGSDGRGLLRLRPRRLFAIDPTVGSSPGTARITIDGSGGFLVSSSGRPGRLWRIGPDRSAESIEGAAQAFGRAYALLRARDGAVWLTSERDLVRFDGHDFERLTPPRVSRALFEDESGALWLAASRTLVRYSRDAFETWDYSEEADRATAYVITQTPDGAIWIGTHAGVRRFDGGRFTSFTARDGLPPGPVRALHVDTDGVLWAGTYGGGLGRFRDGTWLRLSERDGLYDNSISYITEDDHGRLWLNSNRGLFHVARDQVNEMLAGSHSRIFCTPVGSPEANGLAGARTSDGRLCVATVKGLHVVDMNAFAANSAPPVPRIEEIRVNGRRIDAARSVVIPPGPRRVAFRFSGLSLLNPESIQFRYRVTGLDDTWHDLGPQREVTIAGFSAGDHRFELSAANANGTWSDDVAMVALEIQPNYHETVWFRGLIAIGLGGAIALIVHLRLRQLHARNRILRETRGRIIQAQENERQRVARELHDDLNQQLALLSIELDLMRQASDDGVTMRERTGALSSKVETISSTVHRLAHGLHPAKLDRLGIVAATEGLCRELAEEDSLDITSRVDGDLSRLDPDVQLCLYRIVQEALGNAIRHGEGTQATVLLWRENTSVKLRITDNGHGFDPSAARHQHGLGIVSMRERATLAGGRMVIDSAPSRGTSIEVTVPADQHASETEPAP